jgi:hypothetical protein
VLHVFYKAFQDFKSKLEVGMCFTYILSISMRVLYIFAVLCTKLPDVPCLIVPGSSTSAVLVLVLNQPVPGGALMKASSSI